MVYPHIRYEGPAYQDRAGSATPQRTATPETTETEASTRELDSRISDGIHVRLLWHSGDGRVSVAVDDVKTGQAFELPVPPGARALDVYRHPFAYAA
jgi:hypothetical protein